MPRRASRARWTRLAVGAAWLCAGCGGTRSTAPSGPAAPQSVEEQWRVETVLEQPGQRLSSTPSVFFVDGQPVAVTAGRVTDFGSESIVALRRTPDAGWRVEVAKARAAWRVCGKALDDGAILISYGGLHGQLNGLRWTGSEASEAAPARCERDTRVSDDMQCTLETVESERRELRCWPVWRDPDGAPALCPSIVPEAGMHIETYAAALDAQGRMRVAYFERLPKSEGRIRHAVCEAGKWTASTVARTVTADLGMAIGPQGHSHLVFDDQFDDHATLRYASTAPADTAPEIDGRVASALEACRRVRIEASTRMHEGSATFKTGDGFRCAVLAKRAETLKTARSRLDDGCERGDGPSCVLAGMTRDWLLARYNRAVRIPTATTSGFTGQRSGIAVPREARDELGAWTRYVQGCNLGDAQGCALAADLDPRASAKWHPVNALAACEVGWPEACGVALSRRGLRSDSTAVTTAAPVVAASCRAGDLPSCNNLGVIRWLEGLEDEARQHFVVACDASIEAACENLADAEGADATAGQ